MNLSKSLQKILSRFPDPILGLSYPDLGWIREAAGTLRVRLGYPCSAKECSMIQAQLHRLLHDQGVSQPIEVFWRVDRHKVQANLKPKDGIKNVIAVGSGKGGVGKSTVSANLALALKHLGAKVGILDADIYGPSQPHIFGVKGKPEVSGKKFIPLKSHGIELISMGNLVDDEQAMIWRGPMVSGALMQLFDETKWSDLDYLIVDLPPGTGDIQLTMAQKLPIAGAIVVTTPQDLSLLDAKKAVNMFEKVNIPVLGVAENMSSHICSECGHQESLFGQLGGDRLAHECRVPVLGHIPLVRSICEETESGVPTVERNPDSDHAQSFIDVAKHAAAFLAQRPLDYQLTTQSVTVTS